MLIKKIIEYFAKDLFEMPLKLRSKPKSIAKMIIESISPKDHNKLNAILIAKIFSILK